MEIRAFQDKPVTLSLSLSDIDLLQALPSHPLKVGGTVNNGCFLICCFSFRNPIATPNPFFSFLNLQRNTKPVLQSSHSNPFLPLQPNGRCNNCFSFLFFSFGTVFDRKLECSVLMESLNKTCNSNFKIILLYCTLHLVRQIQKEVYLVVRERKKINHQKLFYLFT